jgi:hypothetical protein
MGKTLKQTQSYYIGWSYPYGSYKESYPYGSSKES